MWGCVILPLLHLPQHILEQYTRNCVAHPYYHLSWFLTLLTLFLISVPLAILFKVNWDDVKYIYFFSSGKNVFGLFVRIQHIIFLHATMEAGKACLLYGYYGVSLGY